MGVALLVAANDPDRGLQYRGHAGPEGHAAAKACVAAVLKAVILVAQFRRPERGDEFACPQGRCGGKIQVVPNGNYATFRLTARTDNRSAR